MRSNKVTVSLNKNEATERYDERVIADFIISSLQSWGGALDPEDPLFHSLSVESVSIGRQTFVSKNGETVAIKTT